MSALGLQRWARRRARGRRCWGRLWWWPLWREGLRGKVWSLWAEPLCGQGSSSAPPPARLLPCRAPQGAPIFFTYTSCCTAGRRVQRPDGGSGILTPFGLPLPIHFLPRTSLPIRRPGCTCLPGVLVWVEAKSGGGGGRHCGCPWVTDVSPCDREEGCRQRCWEYRVARHGHSRGRGMRGHQGGLTAWHTCPLLVVEVFILGAVVAAWRVRDSPASVPRAL